MTDGRRATWRPNNPDTNDRALITEARTRVSPNFEILGHGNIGEPSNGALITRLADALETRVNVDLRARILITVCLVEACAITALITVYMIARATP